MTVPRTRRYPRRGAPTERQLAGMLATRAARLFGDFTPWVIHHGTMTPEQFERFRSQWTTNLTPWEAQKRGLGTAYAATKLPRTNSTFNVPRSTSPASAPESTQDERGGEECPTTAQESHTPTDAMIAIALAQRYGKRVAHAWASRHDSTIHLTCYIRDWSVDMDPTPVVDSNGWTTYAEGPKSLNIRFQTTDKWEHIGPRALEIMRGKVNITITEAE